MAAPAVGAPAAEKKKKKKKKKKQKFSDLMASITSSNGRTLEDERKAQQERLRTMTGGGQFQKLERI